MTFWRSSVSFLTPLIRLTFRVSSERYLPKMLSVSSALTYLVARAGVCSIRLTARVFCRQSEP